MSSYDLLAQRHRRPADDAARGHVRRALPLHRLPRHPRRGRRRRGDRTPTASRRPAPRVPPALVGRTGNVSGVAPQTTAVSRRATPTTEEVAVPPGSRPPPSTSRSELASGVDDVWRGARRLRPARRLPARRGADRRPRRRPLPGPRDRRRSGRCRCASTGSRRSSSTTRDAPDAGARPGRRPRGLEHRRPTSGWPRTRRRAAGRCCGPTPTCTCPAGSPSSAGRSRATSSRRLFEQFAEAVDEAARTGEAPTTTTSPLRLALGALRSRIRRYWLVSLAQRGIPASNRSTPRPQRPR